MRCVILLEVLEVLVVYGKVAGLKVHDCLLPKFAIISNMLLGTEIYFRYGFCSLCRDYSPSVVPQKSYMGDKSWRVKLHLATLPFLTPTLLWRVLSITNSQV